MTTHQISLGLPVSVPDDAYSYGSRSDGGTHGLVLTKPHVVELMLDLLGFLTSDEDLHHKTVLEPSCGEGAFVVAAARRLLESALRARVAIESLKDSILAIDIEQSHVELTRANLTALLEEFGISKAVSAEVVRHWVRRADFLLDDQARRFDFVIGNPPYVRIEQISPLLQAEYRRRYTSLYDRADLYVAFIERSLQLLSRSGQLSFICADRWILNKYGTPLRNLVTTQYHLTTYVDLHSASPFESEVIAYPSIFVISRDSRGPTRVARLATASAEECQRLSLVSQQIDARTGALSNDSEIAFYPEWFVGDEPWVITSPVHLKALRDLESRLEPIEFDKRTKVGIGVATGCDRVFIVPDDIGIEADRLVPLVMRDDIVDGSIVDTKRRVLNVFSEAGGLVDLADYPLLQAYLSRNEEAVAGRHVAKKNPRGWYRTIDRVYPDLVVRPKLLIPDIAGSNQVAFDPGNYHPHHNLYFIVSDSWDLEVLGGLLSSKIALFFVWSYAPRMRGGYLRFQAQYLRRIRVPNPDTISAGLKDQIREAFRRRHFDELDRLALKAYLLDDLPHFDFVDTRK